MRTEKRILLEAVRAGAAESDVMAIFGGRILGRDFSGGLVEYMVQDLGMGLVGGNGRNMGRGWRGAVPAELQGRWAVEMGK